MEEICRLCLTLSSPLSLQYLSSTLTQKIESLLTVQVIDNSFLPKQVCSSCTEKIDEIENYHLKVAANQNLLLQYLNEGVRNLNEFYFNLKNNPVKLETDKKNDISGEHIVHNVCIKQEKNDELNEAVVFTNIPIENIETIKEEITDNDDNANDIHSDDNIPLSIVESDKKPEIPQKRKKEKASAKRKKENVPAKRRKESQKEPKSSFRGRGKKVSDRPIKMEVENKSEDGLVTNKQLKCLTCFAFFDTQNNLANHYIDDHKTKDDESESNECCYSKVKCQIPNSDTVEYKLKCDKCDYTNSSEWFMKRHMKCHTDKRPFECKICARTFKTAREIVLHGRAHNDSMKMLCMYRCGYRTAYLGALKNHEALHRLEYKHTCEECGKGFHTNGLFLEHKNIHMGIKPYVCDICGYATHMRRYLQAHRSRLHPESSSNMKRYICVHCSFPCDTMYALNEHMKAEHDIDKRTDFLCDMCGKTLTSKQKLYFHKQTHAETKRQRTRKEFECDICGKKLSGKSHLVVHIKSHNKQRNFRCKCGKRYEQKSSLLRHQTSICGKKLSGKSHLVVHIKSHSKQRNFRCKCGKRYEQKSSLLRHQTRCRRCINQVDESLESAEIIKEAK